MFLVECLTMIIEILIMVDCGEWGWNY